MNKIPLSVNKRTYVAIIGDAGSGKTSLMKSIRLSQSVSVYSDICPDSVGKCGVKINFSALYCGQDDINIMFFEFAGGNELV